ncbi:hypothetical protein [Rheinheimera texasensis]|uniref:hypothetical protein n=1 Tax=Rheinheimera texasensis TaxID=306205 RepID=UPI0004E20ADE|nr:hypothetical protein [Rheinheimera texasensis]
MPTQSSFVKQVHLNSIENMLKRGKKPESIVSHLKAVWCEENEIEQLINEAQSKLKNEKFQKPPAN